MCETLIDQMSMPLNHNSAHASRAVPSDRRGKIAIRRPTPSDVTVPAALFSEMRRHYGHARQVDVGLLPD